LSLVLISIEVSQSHIIRCTAGLLWTSDQLVAEASTYTGHSSEIQTCDPNNQAAKTHTLDHTATRTGVYINIYLIENGVLFGSKLCGALV
jgi:hypothetical protein